MWNPDTVAKLQHSVAHRTACATFKEYTKLAERRSRAPLHAARPAERQEGATPVPLEEVEPAKEIVKRFVTGAMSLGSITQRSPRERWPSP